MFLGVEYLDSYRLVVSLMDRGSRVVQISPYTLEGLFHLIDHSDIRVVAFNTDFNSRYMSSLQNRIIKDLPKKLHEYFEFRVFDGERKAFRTIVYTDTDEFFRKVIRKDLLPQDTVEGIEQRLYNIPKTGIKLNRNLLSKDRQTITRQINAVILSYTALSYFTNNFEIIEDGEPYITPKYRYVPLRNRNAENQENSLK